MKDNVSPTVYVRTIFLSQWFPIDISIKGVPIMKKIMVINGPVMNLPENIHDEISRQAESLGIVCEFFQSNSEGALVTAVQNALTADGVILAAAEYARYSIAIRDAIASINKPVVEVQLVNHSHEGIGTVSMLAPVCAGSIAGFGPAGYILALYALADKLGTRQMLIL